MVKSWLFDYLLNIKFPISIIIRKNIILLEQYWQITKSLLHYYCFDLSEAFQAFCNSPWKFFPSSLSPQLKCFFRKRRFGPDRQNVSRQHEGQQQQKKKLRGHDREHRPGSKNCWLGFSSSSSPPPTHAFAYSNLEKTQNLWLYSFCGVQAKRKLELERSRMSK